MVRALLPFLAVSIFGCTTKDGDETGVTDDADGDGYTATDGDCDDTDASVNPGAAETWYDGVDGDCDGADDYDQDADGAVIDDDCDDTDPTINPAAEDVCDGIDNNCDGSVDEGSAISGWADTDGDGFGDANAPVSSCGDEPGVADNDDDCDDTDPAVYPGAPESCTDAEDLNCDGSVGAVDNDGDGVIACEECDDGDAGSYPGAPEVCDDADNDCNGTIDDFATDATTWYEDADSDTYGDDAVTQSACDQPEGYVGVGGDCDDADTAYNPAASEACTDTVDYNCDGSIGYEDLDGDGYAACEDCNDASAEAFPGGIEVCDGLDNDCNSIADDNATDATTYYIDSDSDGFGDAATTTTSCTPPSGYVDNSDDCDDTNLGENPDAEDTCDTIDNDCDGTVDGDASYYSTYYADNDTDGYGDAGVNQTVCTADAGYISDNTDCDDADSTSYPGGTEVCDDADNDCNSTVDDNATDATTYYTDADADTYGTGTGTAACDQPANTSLADGDCDDGDSTSYPGGTEVCDAADNDCDGDTDEGAGDSETYYADTDGDGYGDLDNTASSCGGAPGGYVSDSTDCDDGDGAVNPMALETCDGIDNNCDGAADESGASGETTWYGDADGDGYGTDTDTTLACSAPSGYVGDASDCDDGDASTYPGASESDDGTDNDCDNWVDEDFVVAGDVVITEVHRQPRFGASSTNTDGQWFEVYNNSTRTVDLSYWYILRTTGATTTDAYFIDPADALTVLPGDYVVLCKTDNYESSSGASYPLLCDYVWGDETQASSYSSTYHDNTFNLQRDTDRLALYINGGSSSGTVVDDITWSYSGSSSSDWPRDSSRSMALDPDMIDASDNNTNTNWCSTAASTSYSWWLSGANYEYGTPGTTNYNCF